MISHIYTKSVIKLQLTAASQPSATVQVIVHPPGCRTDHDSQTPGSCYCYLQGPSCCFLAVWLLFSGVVGLASDSGMLLAPPSTDGLDAT